MSNITLDITPDKTLIRKLGLVGYRTEQAVAELIDNSIDARLGLTETIDVRLDFRLGQISVSDDGSGMDFEGLGDALTVARETKNGKLGQFGLGMKSACSSLGGAFTIRTSKPGSRSVFTAVYDENQWLNDASKNWTNFEIEKSEKTGGWHGTQITINKIKVPLYPNQLLNFRRRFGMRYAPYIERGQIKILVNSSPCRHSEPALAEGTRHPVRIKTADAIMEGWVGLLERRSIKGDYGLHLYRNGRLISAYDKFGMTLHPNAARVVGEMSLDHVPVNFHKTGFLTESPEYREAVSCFMEDPAVRKVMRQASSTGVGASSIRSVLESERGSDMPLLDAKMSAENAKRLLRNATLYVRRSGGKVFDFGFDDSDALDIETAGDRVRVRIGRNNPEFLLFKNPLFLIEQIRMDAEMVAENRSHLPLVERRHRAMKDFAKRMLARRAKNGAPRKNAVPLPGYSLQSELVELHDYLRENFEHAFQFTGLSTLAPFLHNAHRKIVYTIHTLPGAGHHLQDAISDHTGEFVTRLNPGRRDLAIMLEGPEYCKFIVVREYRQRLSPAWATPEKAWMDLYFEVTRDRIPLYRDELEPILEEMLDAGIANPAKLRSLARRRQILGEIEAYLPRE